MATTTATTTGGIGKLKVGDFVRGFALAIIGPVIAIVTTSLDSGSLHFDWYIIKIAAMSGGLGYITKNFFTRARVVISDPIVVEKVKEAEKESESKTTKVTLTTPQ